MDREELIERLRDYLPDYLRMIGIDIGSNGSKNIHCLNPAHKDNNPSMGYDRSNKRLNCFSCGAKYDLYDLIGLNEGITEFNRQLERAGEIFGVKIPKGKSKPSSSVAQNQPKNERYTHMDIHTNTYTYTHTHINREADIPDLLEEEYIDFTPEVEEAHKELMAKPEALAYLQGRGISLETIEAYKLGYHEEGYNDLLKRHPENQNRSKKDNLYKYFLPYPNEEGRYSYFVSEITDRSQTDKYNGKYRKISKGDTGINAQLFNERYIKDPPSSVVFICEGVYDALSVEEAGGKAIALAGTAHMRLLSLCKKYRPALTFVISLDNDGAGKKAIDTIKAGLDVLGISYTVQTAETGKDYNEALQRDREAFTHAIQEIIKDPKKAEYLKTSSSSHLQEFINGIATSVNTPPTPTGFRSLDKILDGGLYEGLYIVGAISSLGKTTFCLQVADQIADSGQDVLIFSLEMARSELMSKSISRHTILDVLDNGGDISNAKTNRGITTGARWAKYSQTEKDIIRRAVEAYGEYAKHIFIHEGIGDIGTAQIKEAVEKHIRIMGNKPVVLIDYLQILAPNDVRASDKQNTDKAVLELKRLARDYKIPVIGISSFNRDNYTAPVNLTSFKESGAIEYGSDALIGLQYEGMDYRDGETDGDRTKRIRKLLKEMERRARAGEAQEIQVKVLKHRNGGKGDTTIDYYPLFNYFKEA